MPTLLDCCECQQLLDPKYLVKYQVGPVKKSTKIYFFHLILLKCCVLIEKHLSPYLRDILAFSPSITHPVFLADQCGMRTF